VSFAPSATGRWPTEVAHLPVCPHRDLPIPFIAERGDDGTGHFTILDNDRGRECLAGRLCAMCGRPMGDEVALLGDVTSLEPTGFWIEPPVHERCAELAAGGLCPYVSRQRVPRRPPEPDVAIVGMGPDELADVGRATLKRPWVMAITRTYTAALTLSHAGSPVLVYLAGPVIRIRRYTWRNGGGSGPGSSVIPSVPASPRAHSEEAAAGGHGAAKASGHA
jgi:hypothetical protein